MVAELSQLPDIVNLRFVAGDTFRIRVRIIDPETENPLPLDQYGFAAEIITPDPERQLVGEFAYSIDMESEETAIFLALSPEQTALLPDHGNGKEFHGLWDLEITFPNADVRTVAKGEVYCYIDVTNSEATVEP